MFINMIAILSIINSSLLNNIFSVCIKFFLQMRGVKVGKNFKAKALPIIIKDQSSDIIIGDNVIFKDRVELRATKGSLLNLNDGVELDRDVRIISTNSSKVIFGRYTRVGFNSVFNCGADLKVGSNVLFAGFCYIVTSNHNISRADLIQNQGHTHKAIVIGDDCWLGGGTFVLPGVELAVGNVVAANSLVNKSSDAYSIIAGSPARLIKHRE